MYSCGGHANVVGDDRLSVMVLVLLSRNVGWRSIIWIDSWL